MTSSQSTFNAITNPVYFSGEQEYPHRSQSSPSGSPISHSGDNDDDSSRNSKRTPKACDRCRHKKTKCTGESPCQRCRLDNTVCSYTNRRPKEGPNFNPQVAQKDAAMSMLYKCIEVMNHKLLAARLGPYSDPAVAEYAESEEFIIGVILDRFGISPVLDEFDNQPVYLPGQRGFNPENCAVEFPNYISCSSTFDGESVAKSQQPFYCSPSALPRTLPTGAGYMEEEHHHLGPKLKKQRTGDTSMTPELDRNYRYDSSPDLYIPKTPTQHPTILGHVVDPQFEFRRLNANTPPPSQRQHSSYSYEHHQVQVPDLEQSAGWNSQKFFEQPVMLLPGDLESLNQYNGSIRTATPPAQSQQQQQRQQGTSQSVYHRQQAHIDRIRRGDQQGRSRSRQSSPARPNYSVLNKQQIPLPPHIAQAAEMDSAPAPQWEFASSVSSAAGLPSYPTSLHSSGMSPEISSLRLGSRQNPNLRDATVTPDSAMYGDASQGSGYMEIAGAMNGIPRTTMGW